MLSQFIERNLFLTAEFLLKHNISPPEQVSLPPDSILPSILIRNREFYRAYVHLLCPSSRKHIGSVVFCHCCSASAVFVRNQALLSASSGQLSIIELPGLRVDPFLLYIKACVLRDQAIALSVIEQLPLFWEAYLLLIELSSSFIPVDGPLSVYYYAYLKIHRDIDCMNNINGGVNNNRSGMNNRSGSMNNRSDCININSGICINENTTTSINNHRTSHTNLDLNTLAALQYCSGDANLALSSFKKLDLTSYFDPSFFEFYAILLYNTNDPSFPLLCESMCCFHRTRYETFVVLGLHKLLLSRHEEARDLLKRAYKSHPTPDIACLLAYAYFRLQDYESATSTYQLAATGSFRSLYSVAQGFFSMGRHSLCLLYCRSALELREDGTIYKLMGRASQGLENAEGAVGYFEKARELGEHDSLLYLAEVYKGRNEREKVLELYEEYVKTGEKNVKVVASYLVDFYAEVGDFKKIEEYKELSSS